MMKKITFLVVGALFASSFVSVARNVPPEEIYMNNIGKINLQENKVQQLAQITNQLAKEVYQCKTDCLNLYKKYEQFLKYTLYELYIYYKIIDDTASQMENIDPTGEFKKCSSKAKQAIETFNYYLNLQKKDPNSPYLDILKEKAKILADQAKICKESLKRYPEYLRDLYIREAKIFNLVETFLLQQKRVFTWAMNKGSSTKIKVFLPPETHASTGSSGEGSSPEQLKKEMEELKKEFGLN